MKGLKQRIIHHFRQVTQQSYLSIGVEQEFFLLYNDGTPVNHELSQLFIKSLHHITKRGKAIDENIGEYIEYAKDKLGNKIKYDHHPHLFEIETLPFKNINKLKEALTGAFENILTTADQLKVNICFDPILPFSTSQPEAYSELQFRKNLVNYRRKLFELRNEDVDEALANYAAGIISTQIHIGGIAFDQYNDIFPALYEKEPSILNWTKAKIKSHLPANEVLERRNKVYKKTFSKSPLVCYPSFNWTTDSWLNALFKTPLFGSAEEYFSGHTLNEFPVLDIMNENEFLYRVRDLQWIKPHRQGTIEFRSIPALPTIDDISELCEIRMNTVKELL